MKLPLYCHPHSEVYFIRTANANKWIAQIALLFACLFLLFNKQAFSQTTVTVTCTGAAGSYHSGSVNSAGTKNEGNMITINSSSNRGWAEFDLSSLPSGVTVTNVDLIFTTYTSSASTATNNIYGFTGDASVMAGTTLYTNCGSGTSFNTLAWTANALNTLTLNASGNSFIQTNAGGLVNIGFVRGSTNTYNIYGYASNAPYLVITYTCPATTSAAASSITCSGFNANWSAVSGVIDYRLDVATNVGFSSFVPGFNDLNVGNVTTYAVPGLSGGTTYYYRVRAVTSCGTSANSATQSPTTLGTPSAPTNSAETNVTCSSFDANWTAIAGVDHYMLDVSPASNFSVFVTGYQDLNVGNVTTYAVNSGLSPGTNYYYRVRAIDVCGQTSTNAAAQLVTTLTTPTAPTNNAETNVYSTSFSANWSTIAGVSHYMLDVATDAGFTSYVTGYQDLNVGNVTTYSVNSNITCNTTYYYRVRAVNPCGQVSTNAAAQTLLTRQCNDECAGAIPLTIGTSCVITNGASNNATQSLAALTCTSVLGNADDDVWYSFVATCANITITVARDAALLNYAPVVDLRDGCTGNSLACVYNLTSATINYTSLTVGNTYYIRTYDNAAGGGDFDICIYNPILTAPTNNAETNVTCSSFDANWSAIAGADHYMLDVATNTTFTSFVAGYQDLNVGNVTTYPVTGLSANTSYYYRVRAVDVCGQASTNAAYQTAPTSAPLTAPTNNAETNVTCSSFSANWSAISGVDHYMLDVSPASNFSVFVTGYQDLNVGNVTTYAVNSGLSPGTNYYYRVRAIDVCGQTSTNAAAQLVTVCRQDKVHQNG